MRTITLFLMSLLLGVTSSHANEQIAPDSYRGKTTKEGVTKRYRNPQPIRFVERGVTFFVFPNGEFDFNTHRSMYRRGRRGNVNATFGAPGIRVRYTRPRNRDHRYGVRIEHDRFGKVRRVGNTFINYDRSGRVKRIGSVYMQYGRFDQLRQIGGMRVKYNRWGRLIWSNGTVKHRPIGHIDHYDHDDDLYDDWDDDDWDDDDDNFYYRSRKSEDKDEEDD